MRTQAQWDNYTLPKLMKQFSPRLQRDLQNLDIILPKEDKSKPGSFYIHGETNTGKTTTAAKMFLEVCEQRYFNKLKGTYIWTTTYDFFEALKKEFDHPAEIENSTMIKFTSAAQLYLDDLGDIKITDWGLSQLQVLINQRYEALLPIVITSNLSLEELTEVTGDGRISSRIGRMCKIMGVNE